MPEVKLIAAIDDEKGIAIGQKLPWDLPTDRKHFQDKIKDGPVVMGWNTFVANNGKPYGQGANTVITRRQTEAVPGVWIVHDATEFFEKNTKDIWVAGGGQIFAAAMPYATKLYITKVEGKYGANIFFPEFTPYFTRIDTNKPQTENGITYTFQVWERIA